jgi:hypothetical protein
MPFDYDGKTHHDHSRTLGSSLRRKRYPIVKQREAAIRQHCPAYVDIDDVAEREQILDDYAEA